MTGLKKLNSCLFSILVATTAVSAQADIFSSRSAKHGGAYVSVEGFDARGIDTLLANFPYAQIEQGFVNVGPNRSDNFRVLHFDPDRDWGFRVAVGYDFPSCCPCNYGGSLEYTYFNFDDHRHNSVPVATGTGAVSQLFSRESVFPGTYHVVDAKIDSRYDAVDLLGHVNRVICNCVDTQFFIGARYVHLDQSLNEHFASAAPIGATNNVEKHIDFKNRFNGIGPRVGIAGFYPIIKNFGVTSEIAGNLIFGYTSNRYAEDRLFFTVLGPSASRFTQSDTYVADIKSKEKFVPGWSGKVGLAYHADFCNCSSLIVEIGYRGDKYYEISGIKSIVDAVAGDPSLLKDGEYQDFEFSGPYISLAYHM